MAIALIIATASMSANATEILCISPNSIATADWGRNIEKKANEALKKHREEKANKEREKFKKEKEKREKKEKESNSEKKNEKEKNSPVYYDYSTTD